MAPPVPQGTPRPRFVRSFWAYMEGAFVNQVLPSTIGGDAIRVLRWRSEHMPTAEAFATVLVDRISGATGAALLAALASVLLLARDIADYRALSILVLSAGFLFGGVCFVALMRWPKLHGLLHYVDRLHPALQQAQRALVLGRRFLISLGYSLVGHSLSGIAVYVLARSLSVDLPLSLTIGITGVVILISMIPISLAGWGDSRGKLYYPARSAWSESSERRSYRHSIRPCLPCLGIAGRVLASFRLAKRPNSRP